MHSYRQRKLKKIDQIRVYKQEYIEKAMHI